MNPMQSSPIRLLLVAVFLLGSLAACKEDSSDEGAAELAETTATLAGNEEELLRKRDALLNSRRKLREKREALEAERIRVIERGGDTSEVEQQQAALKAEEEKLGERETQFNSALNTLFSQQRNVLAELASKGDGATRITARETSMAGREKVLASREAQVAAREAQIAEREAALAKREKDTCGVSTVQTVAVAPPQAGTTYRKKDVDPLLQRARRHMSKKGILRYDLPAPAKGLEKEATSAMKKGDYASAHFAARQLMATVDSTRIDRGFIRAKISRLSAKMTGTKLSEKKQKSVDKLFKEATRYYGDGKYTKSNKKLNQIYSTI